MRTGHLAFGIAPGDLGTFVATAGILGAVVLVATYVPGRRATYIRHAAQVALEDFSVVLLAARVGAALGAGRSAVMVGALFAAGHIPALLATGATSAELLHLFLDAGLATGMLLLLFRVRDIVWFVPVHFAMDMTQFLS